MRFRTIKIVEQASYYNEYLYTGLFHYSDHILFCYILDTQERN